MKEIALVVRTERMLRRGFTLVEMLVTFGVIAVLVAIAFPVFASVRATARSVACQVNLRELYPPLLGYAEDHRGELPFAETLYSAPYDWTAPLDAIEPYIDVPLPSFDLLRGELTTGPPWLCPADRDGWGSQHGLSYGYHPAEFMQIIGARETTRLYEDNPHWRVFADRGPFHREPNALHYDGSIGKAATMP